MLVDKQNELMSDLLFTVHQRGVDYVTWKPPITELRTVKMPDEFQNISKRTKIE